MFIKEQNFFIAIWLFGSSQKGCHLGVSVCAYILDNKVPFFQGSFVQIDCNFEKRVFFYRNDFFESQKLLNCSIY